MYFFVLYNFFFLVEHLTWYSRVHLNQHVQYTMIMLVNWTTAAASIVDAIVTSPRIIKLINRLVEREPARCWDLIIHVFLSRLKVIYCTKFQGVCTYTYYTQNLSSQTKTTRLLLNFDEKALTANWVYIVVWTMPKQLNWKSIYIVSDMWYIFTATDTYVTFV